MRVTEIVERLEALLSGRTNRGAEQEVLDLLGQARAAVLDAALTRIDVVRLVRSLDDRLRGPRNRAALLELLSETRLQDLGIAARAAIVHALQVGRTSAADERAATAVLLGTHAEDLVELKNAIDAGDDHRDLQQLVYRDIDSKRRRQRILEHLREQGTRVARRDLKVLSDIDDTFYANWKDKRFPPKTVYPGVRELYHELDVGPGGTERSGDLVFVTARPGDRPGIIERKTHATLRGLGLDGFTILTGSFRKVVTQARIASKKLQNFLEYSELYPEYDFVFIGDSGQKDADFGARMTEEHPDRVRAVLIHDVMGRGAEERRTWARKGVVFFDTYVGAALEALGKSLVHEDAVHRVARAAAEQLDAIAFDSEQARDERRRELDRDLKRARSVLGS